LNESIEVRIMTTPSGNRYLEQSVVELESTFGDGSPNLNLKDYLNSATQELNTLTELANQGEAIGRDSRDWMLAQVDFIVEVIGNDNQELGDEMRSNLLHLLLAIANLNEQIRHQASLSL
jgi:hypothetical protein